MAFQNNGKKTTNVSNFLNQVILTTVEYLLLRTDTPNLGFPSIYILLTSSSFPRKTQNIGLRESALADWLSDSLHSL